jgi:hypothetical protein
MRMKAPRLSPWFWPLVESLGGDVQAMSERFKAMPRQRLLAFRRMYDRALSHVHPYHRGDFVFGDRDCSEDHADDFAAWVVSRGREFWDEVRRHPKDGPRYLDEFAPIADKEMDRRPDFIAGGVLHERYGENIVLVLYHPDLVERDRQQSAEQRQAEPNAAPDPAGM